MAVTFFELATHGPGLYEVTDDVCRWIAAQGGDGLLVLMVQHTSASLLIQENAAPDVQRDLQAFFERLVPQSDDPSMGFLRHTIEGPDDMPAHIKAALTACSLSVPLQQGRLALGTWQGIYLWEHRHHRGEREVVVNIMGPL